MTRKIVNPMRPSAVNAVACQTCDAGSIVRAPLNRSSRSASREVMFYPNVVSDRAQSRRPCLTSSSERISLARRCNRAAPPTSGACPARTALARDDSGFDGAPSARRPNGQGSV